MSRKVFFNGDIISECDAKVSIYDSALMFGDVVFEMTRSFNGIHFELEAHVDRLLSGLKAYRIGLGYSKADILEACHQVAEINTEFFEPDDEHRLLINVTRGPLSIYKNVQGLESKANLIIADFPLRWTIQNCSHLYTQGVDLVVPLQRAIPARYLDPKIKNRSRVFYLMANIQASNFSGDNNWALLLDENGCIAEGTGSNFFMIKDGVMYTPRGRDILRGISRRYVIETLAPALGIEVRELDIEPFDVMEADEAFLTSTPFCMIPAVTIDRLKIGDGRPGAITERLLRAWSSNVGLDIVGQIEAWDAKFGGGVTPYAFGKNNPTLTMNISDE